MLIRQLKELPSKADLAREFHVSERTIGRAMAERDEQQAINNAAFVTLRELVRW
jgi:DNA-binding GntR family transcriptional regulator